MCAPSHPEAGLAPSEIEDSTQQSTPMDLHNKHTLIIWICSSCGIVGTQIYGDQWVKRTAILPN